MFTLERVLTDIEKAKIIYLQLLEAKVTWDRSLVAAGILISSARDVGDEQTRLEFYEAIMKPAKECYRNPVFTASIYQNNGDSKFNLSKFYADYDSLYTRLKESGKIGNVMMLCTCHLLLKLCSTQIIELLLTFDYLSSENLSNILNQSSRSSYNLDLCNWFNECRKDKKYE